MYCISFITFLLLNLTWPSSTSISSPSFNKGRWRFLKFTAWGAGRAPPISTRILSPSLGHLRCAFPTKGLSYYSSSGQQVARRVWEVSCSRAWVLRVRAEQTLRQNLSCGGAWVLECGILSVHGCHCFQVPPSSFPLPLTTASQKHFLRFFFFFCLRSPLGNLT